ncbi:50S ribosomal protein L2 [Candidatus Woesearchaeota archaeon]|nr:50S ribosomal protein L2 [Candidatus Woesearchaeota archaeon]
MGKNLIQQRRGRGTATFRAPSFRYKGNTSHNKLTDKTLKGKIIDLITCQGHSAPLAQIQYENGEKILMIAPEGIRVGDSIESGPESKAKAGNILPLKSVPTGTTIYNIESQPGDGGKFVKSSGTSAKVAGKTRAGITILLPSSKKKIFNPECRACIGIIAGSGRLEKPFLKAGNRYYAKKVKNKIYPHVQGISMNAVAHPFGGKSSRIKGRPLQASRNAPPGRKVGNIAPRRSGHKR